MVNYKGIADNAEIDQTTAKNWLRILETLGIIFYLHPIEIKKTAAPEKKMIRSFSVIERAPLLRGTGAILCLTERLGAFDRENLIVPITLI